MEYPRSGDVAFIYGPLLRAAPQPARATPAAPETTTMEPTAPPVPSGPSWSIAENQPCEVWNYGNRDYEPLTWSGACTDGKASGEGGWSSAAARASMKAPCGTARCTGRGVLDWANGFRYEGELRDGKQHGQGTFTQAGGEYYVGAWRNGRPHGQGTYTQLDGTTFDGTWRDGCFGEREGRWASIGTTAAACGFE